MHDGSYKMVHVKYKIWSGENR